MVKKGQFWVVIRVVEKWQFWFFFRVVTRRQLLMVISVAKKS